MDTITDNVALHQIGASDEQEATPPINTQRAATKSIRTEKIGITEGDVIIAETVYAPKVQPPIQYVRRNADGGGFITVQAMKHGLSRIAHPPVSMGPILETG